jgi:hypothetical protein
MIRSPHHRLQQVFIDIKDIIGQPSANHCDELASL